MISSLARINRYTIEPVLLKQKYLWSRKAILYLLLESKTTHELAIISAMVGSTR